MFIAILDFSTAAADRPAALAQLDKERGQVQAMPGNIAFRVYAGREDDTRITVVQRRDFAGTVAIRLGESDVDPVDLGNPAAQAIWLVSD